MGDNPIMPGADREELKQTFEQVPELYDRARPDYPDELFDDLIHLAALQPDARLLEIGCGTGKATVPLAVRCFRITCLEIGPGLASVARRKLSSYRGVEVILTSFESWHAGGEPFDLVYAATSWHWLNPEIRYRKAASVLSEEGKLAFFSVRLAFPEDVDPFFYEIQKVYEAIGLGGGESWFHGSKQWPPPPPEEVPDDASEIVASGYFDEVQVKRYVWERQYTSEQYIALLNTFSGHIAMDRDKRQFLYGEIQRRIDTRPNGKVRRHWLAILHVARRA